jgi:uncharacterized surface protein with fasciclin (FAS1) repeats
MIRKLIAMSVAATFATAGTLNAQVAGHAEPTNDIVDVAAEAGSFTTLLAAAKAAGLVEALKGEGPMTVFAPTDEAFANLPAGTVESLLLPENKDKLTAILLYHVVEGKVTSDKVVDLASAPTLQGQSVKITVKEGEVYINEAKVLKADVGASNGVIHVVDKVILPTLN